MIHRSLLPLSCALAAGLLAAAPAPVSAQSHLERTPLLDAGWEGIRGMLHVDVASLFDNPDDAGGGFRVSPTYRAAVSLPLGLVVGASLTPNLELGTDSDPWDAFVRYARPELFGVRGLRAAATASRDGAFGSVDGELALSGWVGGIGLVGALRGYSKLAGGDANAALAAGAVAHPLPGRLPIALAADWIHVLDDEGGAFDDVWSAGLQVGVPYTVFTLSLHATNAGAPTLHGAALDAGLTRWGVSLTAPVPVGRFLGWFAPREVAMRSVREAEAGTPDLRAGISRNAFWPMTLEVSAGSVIEWTNEDRVVHTVTADDASFNSGAIQPGGTWRARFDEPGVYPFHCGPHPFMQGVVVVR